MSAAQTVGAHVRQLRQARGWSQSRLGAAIADHLHDEAWRARQAVSSGELGRRAWTADEIAAVAYVLGVRPGELFESVCGSCFGAPPAGFACLSCGTETKK